MSAQNFSDRPYQALPSEEVLRLLNSCPEGLTDNEAAARLARHGPNELARPKKNSPLGIFLRQFASLLMLILLAAIIISLFLQEILDAAVIVAILLACAVLGFIQEYRAEKAAQALAKLAAPTATVVREGREVTIPSREVVPGDVLVLHNGDRVAADGRLLESVNLKADEALLTGESIPMGKNAEAEVPPEAPVAEQASMVFGGTVITYGRGRAVVTATGRATQFGRIAQMLAEVETEKTPLERRMTTIGRVLAAVCLAAALGAMLLGIWRGEALWPMIIWGVSLAVAAVPEALPAVVTGALAIGTTRMARRHAIIKRLPAVETMGCTTVICTDKTGTLTKNEMTVRRLYLDGRTVEVTGAGYEPQGEFLDEGRGEPWGREHPVLQQAARVCLLCNDASLKKIPQGWQVQGDPTEGSLLVLGLKAGLNREGLLKAYPRVAEIPFTSERKRMSTIHQGPEGLVMCLKGAPESLLPYCSRSLTAEGEKPLPENAKEDIARAAAAMAARAFRVLGLAYRSLEWVPDLVPASEETELVWLGLVGMLDPARPEAKEAVRRCHEAGIRVIMVTGDHPDTARAIARDVGLLPENPVRGVLSGPEVDAMNDAALLGALQEVTVFARVTPEHKLRLVRLLKSQGEVVAMTGDGVNDAPALKQADIGVAMGITGTEVTKETAAMILADDNFASLVAAVEEGRAIFDNIKKYLIYLLSCNFSEVLTLSGAILLGLPLPLLALQILWVNLITDGLPALALGVDPKAPDIMQRPPRPPQEGAFTRPVTVLLVVISLYLTLILLSLFAYYVLYNPRRLPTPGQVLIQAQTMVFITLVLTEMVNAFNCRSDLHSLFTVGFFRNRVLVLSVLVSLGIMVIIIQWPPLSGLFHTRALARQDWLLAAALSLTILPVVEMTKWLLRRRLRQGTEAQLSSPGGGAPPRPRPTCRFF
ncbi:MAG: cation-translocating P-type ATPase [Desulfobaccales bacterium]